MIAFFFLLKTKQLHLDCLRLSGVAGGQDGGGLLFKKFSYPSLRQNQKCTIDYSSCT